jgi:hypothetical protein
VGFDLDVDVLLCCSCSRLYDDFSSWRVTVVIWGCGQEEGSPLSIENGRAWTLLVNRESRWALLLCRLRGVTSHR